jgi:KDO2-lipid IV(A) lauroyltransferase|tara:strand:+ start:29753 stop:30625 length:873 start_codon:yes stop_codon:yes gene_type:complete
MKKKILIIIINLWKMLVSLPRFMHKPLGYFIGLIFYILPLNRNLYSKKNIDLCFAELDSDQRSKIYRKNIFNSGITIISTGIAWFWTNKRINRSIKYNIKGLDGLVKQQEDGNGVLLIFKHSLHLELDSRILGMNIPVYGVERVHNSDYFDSVQSSGRLKGLKDSADKNQPIKFIRWLKTGKTVLYAIDQDYGINSSEVMKFFGNNAATITAPYKIVESAKCKTYFLNSYIENNTLILSIESFIGDMSSPINFSQSINDFIENKIKLHPDEYLWQHRRFKSTLGKDNFYK